MATGNPSNYQKDDPIFGSIDLDDEYITNQWLVDQFVGNNLFAFGSDYFSQLGNGVPSYTYGSPSFGYSSPIQIGSLTNWKQVFGGYYHTAAIKTDGTLWTCGYNNRGQLGNGTNTQYSSPIQIGTLTNWKQVDGNAQYTAAIKTDGTLWTWGDNYHGQLGNGTLFNYYSSPIQVGSLTNWKQVSGGYYHTAAIKTDGTLWTCGYNYYGQLGNRSTTDVYSPIQIGTLTNWKQVACGFYHTTAIKTDGTLWTWGDNYNGQLGNRTSGVLSSYSSPIQVGSLTNWKQVWTGSRTVMAIKTDGTLWGWGLNNYGQLGNGTTTNYSSPIQVGALTNWKQVAFGSIGYTAAVKTDGTLWTWGDNYYGSLGNGTHIYYSSPIQVGSLTNWKQVAGGYYHTLAIKFADIT